jgi:hypothetical protein
VKNEYIYAVAENGIYLVFKAEEVCGKDKSMRKAFCFRRLRNQSLNPEVRVSY